MVRALRRASVLVALESTFACAPVFVTPGTRFPRSSIDSDFGGWPRRVGGSFEATRSQLDAQTGIFVEEGIAYSERWQFVTIADSRRTYETTCKAFPSLVVVARERYTFPEFGCGPADVENREGPALVLRDRCGHGFVSFNGAAIKLVRSEDSRRFSVYFRDALVGAIHPSNDSRIHGVWMEPTLPLDTQAAIAYASFVLYWFDARVMRNIARGLCF